MSDTPRPPRHQASQHHAEERRGFVLLDVGIALNGRSDDNLIERNIIGLDATATVAQPNGAGIDISYGIGNTIGGSAGASNVISGNLKLGISLLFSTSTVISGDLLSSNGTAIEDFSDEQTMISGVTIRDSVLDGIFVIASEGGSITSSTVTGTA